LDIDEVAQTAWRTWSLPELTQHRKSLVAEVPVYGRIDEYGERLVSGRADAVAYGSGKLRIVFDWKSDVAPNAAARAGYVNQIAQYARVLGADRGAIVYMSLEQVQWVSIS